MANKKAYTSPSESRRLQRVRPVRSGISRRLRLRTRSYFWHGHRAKCLPGIKAKRPRVCPCLKTDLDRAKVEGATDTKPRSPLTVDYNSLSIDELFVPEEDLVGEDGRGFYLPARTG